MTYRKGELSATMIDRELAASGGVAGGPKRERRLQSDPAKICRFARVVTQFSIGTNGSTSTASPSRRTPRDSCIGSAARDSIPNNEGKAATGRDGRSNPASLYVRHVRSCSFVLRLFRNQNPAQVHARSSRAELRPRLEQAMHQQTHNLAVPRNDVGRVMAGIGGNMPIASADNSKMVIRL
jgi:hypothetical protein